MKFAFYVSNTSTRLINLLKKLQQEKSPILSEISFIYIDNNTNKLLKNACFNAKINFIEESIINIEKKQVNQHVSDKVLALLLDHKVDYLFIFCDKLLKGKILSKYKNKIVNFHPSILPSFKGFNAIDKAIQQDAYLLGNTAHFVDKSIDNGPIIMQSIIHRSEFRGYDSVLNLQILMIIQIMKWFREKRIFVKNRKVFVKDADYSLGKYVPHLETDHVSKI